MPNNFLKSIVCLFLCVAVLYGDETFDKLFSAGKYKEALDYADQKIAPTSRNAATWVKIAMANEKVGLIEKALASYLVSWRMNPKDYESLLGAARIYNTMDQPDNAITFAQRALEVNFTGEASWEYARACIELKKPQEAKAALEKVISTDPNNVVANRELGIIYFNNRMYKDAIPLLLKSYNNKQDEQVAYQIGKSYQETQDIDRAMEYYKKALEKNSDFKEVRIELARCNYQKNLYAEAISEYSKVAGKLPFSINDNLNMAYSYEKLNKESDAIASYRLAIKDAATSKEKEIVFARHKIGNYELKNKKYQEALDQFLAILDADPKALLISDIYFLCSDAYMGTGNSAKAIANLEKEVVLFPSNIEGYARLADLYSKNNMGDKAKATYEKMMSLSPNDPEVYRILGDYNVKVKKYDKALELYSKSNDLKKSADAYEGIAICAAALNQWAKALDAAKNSVQLDGDRLDARKVLAEALMKDSNFGDAKVQYEYLTKKLPNEKEYWIALAKCYEVLKDTENLSKVDQKILGFDKNNGVSKMRLALYTLSKGNKDEAYQQLKECISLKVENQVLLYKNLFTLAIEKKEQDNAVSYLKKYLTLSPDDAESHKLLGDMLYDVKDYDGALLEYRAAIKLNPSLKGFYKRYAEIVIAKGQEGEVISALTSVIKSGEADFGTYTTLGMIYMKKNMAKEAREMYQKALMIDPQNTDALTALAECEVRLGNISAAVITYEQAVMMNPNASKEYKALGDLYQKQKKNDLAIKAYKSYLDKNSSDDEIAIKVGDYFYDKKEYKDAVKYLAMVKGKDASSTSFRIKLAECNFNTGNYNDAIALYNKLSIRTMPPEIAKNILLMKAEAQEKIQDTSGALSTYDDISDIKGLRDENVDFKRAFFREHKDQATAMKLYEENIRKYPKDNRNVLQLGILYSKNPATMAKAVTLLEQVSSKIAKDKDLLLQLANIYKALKKSDKELETLKKYIDLNPQDQEATIRAGALLIEKGKTTEGLVYLETANTLNPNDLRIIIPLAKGYTQTNRYKESIALLQKAKTLKPDDNDFKKQLFAAYLKNGNKKEALAEAKDLVNTNKDKEFLLLYAQLQFEDEKLKEAENTIEDIRAVDPEDIPTMLLLAKVQRSQKRYDDAIKTYQEIIQIDGNNADALYERAETHLLQGKPQWAERFYERAVRAAPKSALPHLGLAKIAKLKKDNDNYLIQLKLARELEPANPLIIDECKKAGI